MDQLFAKIAANTVTANLGDEEIWRRHWEPFHSGEQPQDVRVVRDQRYGPAQRNLLDVYIPTADSQKDRPVLLFVHGGGFFSGDKGWSDKLWANIGNYFAQQGMVVVTANHQFVPFDNNESSDAEVKSTVQYPAGADDMQLVREWIYENIASEKFGNGSVDKVVLFGHSSGGAHIAMNLYAAGDPQRASSKVVHPPVAGIIYLSVPFWYDRMRPIRRKILQRYYGSDAEEIWGPRCALGLFRNLPDDSPLLDSSQIPTYIGITKWEVKEACDGAIAFFNAYRARSRPSGTLPIFHVMDKHNHFTNVMSIGTSDNTQASKLLEFIKTCTDSDSNPPNVIRSDNSALRPKL
ncbi:uncharacterized protein N7459_005997 [Penicillium hispanicum]|uniref:uncharacterized protein n=1 Tax=Penicillium hispanicum TaxID=1080232 RepID=UPI00253F8234|nr:uncharacterized protein N7459_005997 [Penicillium hispanicum]KAJ5580012.1 hypothetical protein N7459_005997 [Penicillium hispanicum]